MIKVFSFTLFGDQDRYCKGMLCNVEEIEKRFPDFKIWIYIGDSVPNSILIELANHSSVKLLFTGETGMVNKVYRYLPIDDPEVELMIVRDSDSRVYQRDEQSVHDFMKSEKRFQIIRDHRVHTIPILGGLFGVKKGCLEMPMIALLTIFFEHDVKRENFGYEDDQNFLRRWVYPRIVYDAYIQDEYDQHFEPPSMHVKISTPRVFPDFIGQIYMFNEDGSQYTVCGP
jgi:protein O-GlcNAc transferase